MSSSITIRRMHAQAATDDHVVSSASRQHIKTKHIVRAFNIRSPKHVGFFLFLLLLVYVTHVSEKRILFAIESEGAGSAPAASSAIVGMFGHIFKMTGRDEKWSLWHSANDQSTAHALSQEDVSCEWTEFRPSGIPENTTHMCTYPVATDVYVSGQIHEFGRWSECDTLVDLWKEATERHAAASLASSQKTAIYLDVGGNIGSCVMEMLQSTDAKIVVFEPHPHNLAQITTTIMGQPEHVHNRVAIYPVGVGDVTGNFTMYMSTNNRGHSVVGEKVEDSKCCFNLC